MLPGNPLPPDGIATPRNGRVKRNEGPQKRIQTHKEGVCEVKQKPNGKKEPPQMERENQRQRERTFEGNHDPAKPDSEARIS